MSDETASDTKRPSKADIRKSTAFFMKQISGMPYPVSEGVALYKKRGALAPDVKEMLLSLLMVGTLWGRRQIPPGLGKAPFVGREEANAMTAFCFRNTHLEDIHAGLDFTDTEMMKKLMIESSGKVKAWLGLRDSLSSSGLADVYVALVRAYGLEYAREWVL